MVKDGIGIYKIHETIFILRSMNLQNQYLTKVVPEELFLSSILFLGHKQTAQTRSDAASDQGLHVCLQCFLLIVVYKGFAPNNPKFRNAI